MVMEVAKDMTFRPGQLQVRLDRGGKGKSSDLSGERGQ
jgi:hypothetical protein